MKPEIPGETLTPCPLDNATPETVNELAASYIKARGAAECANGKIEVIAEILKGPN